MIKTQTKSRGLEETLVRMIIDDDLKPGDAILSENKISTLFGISRVTVRKAIAGLTDKGILRSENGSGTFVVKVPCVPASRETRSRLIGFVCYGGIDNAYMSSIARGVESGTEMDGYHICVGSVLGGAEREACVVRDLLKRGIDGIIISPTESDPPSPFLIELAKSGVEMVVIDERIPELDAPSVACDDIEGGFLATSALIKAGHRRIAHIRGPGLVVNTISRFEGYRMALERNGIAFQPELAPQHAVWNEESARKSMLKLLELPPRQRPTAVFVANDYLTADAWSVIEEHGAGVPEDFSLIGYGNVPNSKGFHMSTVDQRPLEIGSSAWSILKRLLGGDKTAKTARILLRPEIILRQSIAAPNPA
ncbi:MAG: GntR family transcriptional regulator [Victivallales bacterium]